MAKYEVDLFDYFSASYSEGQWSTLIEKNANVAYIVNNFTEPRFISQSQIEERRASIETCASANDSNRSPVQTRMSMFQNYLKHLSENDPNKWQQFKEKANYLVTTRNILLNLMDQKRIIRLRVQYLKGKLYVAEEDMANFQRKRASGVYEIIKREIMKRMTQKVNQESKSINQFFVVFNCKLNSLNIIFYGLVMVAESYGAEKKIFSLKNIADLQIRPSKESKSENPFRGRQFFQKMNRRDPLIYNNQRKYFQCRLSGMSNVIQCSWKKVDGHSLAHGVTFSGEKVPLTDAFGAAKEDLEDIFERRLKYLEGLFSHILEIVGQDESIYLFQIDSEANPSVQLIQMNDGSPIIYEDIEQLLTD